MALRRGFVRYAFSIQYHGSSFLGFPYLKEQEDAILKDGTDLRGYRSVEGRLREALSEMVGEGRFENIRVSSRTDRGVHALKNTCSVDIRTRSPKEEKEHTPVEDMVIASTNVITWDPDVLRKGLNYYLSRQGSDILQVRTKKRTTKQEARMLQRRARRKMDNWPFHYPMNELRILRVIRAPLTMKNIRNFITHDNQQPDEVEWNVRFSAFQRTYIYRILACNFVNGDWALPFEWDRSWKILPPKLERTDYSFGENENGGGYLDVDAMQEAATYFLGTHDFSSFRGAGCQRASPVVTMENIQVTSQPYGEPLLWEASGGFLGLGDNPDAANNSSPQQQMPQLVNVKIVGSSFLYHQVRNMVGALVSVGRKSLEPDDISAILAAKDRTIAPPMAPAHGLFLANVKHDGIVL